MAAVTQARVHPVEHARPATRRLLTAALDTARDRPLRTWALLLLVGDLFFTVIQGLVDALGYSFNGAYRLALETEWGGGQIFGYAQEVAAAVLLLVAWRRYRSPSAGFWAAAFGYLALDDAVQLHERLGRFLVGYDHLPAIGAFRPQDLGEAIAYVLIGLTALGALLFAERHDPLPNPTALTRLLVPLTAVYLFFAAAIDTVGLDVPIAVEDGGELFALTALLLASAAWVLYPGTLAMRARSERRRAPKRQRRGAL